jgi:hypothetical protein
MSRGHVLAGILILVIVMAFSPFLPGRSSSLQKPSDPVLSIDETALPYMTGRGNEFYVRPGRAG